MSIRAGLNYLDETARFHTTKDGREWHRILKAGNNHFHPFESSSQIYILSLSIGLLSDQRIDDQKIDELLFTYPIYVNQDEYGVFPLIMKSKHPELDNSSIVRMMDKYAEYGLGVLYKQYEKDKRIDFQDLLKLRPKV